MIELIGPLPKAWRTRWRCIGGRAGVRLRAGEYYHRTDPK